MNNTIYQEKTYFKEKNYTDWFCMDVEISQVGKTLNLVIDSMQREINALQKYMQTDYYTKSIEDMIETLYLCEYKLCELSESCRANEERAFLK